MRMTLVDGERWETRDGGVVYVRDGGAVWWAIVVRSERARGSYRVDPTTLEAYTGDRRDDLLHPIHYGAEQMGQVIDLLKQILASLSKRDG